MPTLFFCKRLAQLYISALLFNLLSLGLSKKVLGVSALELSPSWGVDSSASFVGLGFFAPLLGVDCVPVEGANVGD